MDVADQLEDCSPTHEFLLMLLDRVQGLEDGIQRIEKVLADPLQGLHGTDELHIIRDCILRSKSEPQKMLQQTPSDAAVQALRCHGFRAWEAVVDKKAYHKQAFHFAPTNDTDGFAVYNFVTRADAPDPRPQLYESFKEHSLPKLT